MACGAVVGVGAAEDLYFGDVLGSVDQGGDGGGEKNLCPAELGKGEDPNLIEGLTSCSTREHVAWRN